MAEVPMFDVEALTCFSRILYYNYAKLYKNYLFILIFHFSD